MSPGEDFPGATIGAGMILYASAFSFKDTQRFFDEKSIRIAKISALCVYGLIGIYYYVTGVQRYRESYSAGDSGTYCQCRDYFPINICVGLEVACTMYAFYALFRRGGL